MMNKEKRKKENRREIEETGRNPQKEENHINRTEGAE